MFQKSVKGFKPKTLSTYRKISAFLGHAKDLGFVKSFALSF